jgi:hypothetical protein
MTSLESLPDWKDLAGEVNTPEIDLSALAGGKYKLRLFPVDRWGREGILAETVLTIEEDLPIPEAAVMAEAEKPNEETWHFRYNYFAALSSYTINQNGGLGDSTGADLSVSWLNSTVGARRGETDIQLRYQTYNISAESADKELSFAGHEVLLDTSWRHLIVGAGLRDVPYLNVKDGSFKLESQALPFAELGWRSSSFSLQDTLMFLAIKYRHHVSPQGVVKNYDVIVLDEEGHTLLSKNGLYLYHGLELSYERVGLEQSSTQNVFRGLMKMGFGLEL